MALKPGTCLGRYEILSAIGAGGMGEVYRAHDSQLARDVAIKILPKQLSVGARSLARFDREARALGALSHPTIVAIYDVGSHKGVRFVVTELLQGETLRTKLARGPLDWRQAAQIGASVAAGLSAAHSKGIVHCDLKPENLFLKADGSVKILDFGLARVLPVRVGPLADVGDTTQSLGPIESGSLAGTVGYLSPEQARGIPASPASDIFSLGCVLYEMVEGRRAFPGRTAAEILSSILRDAPAPLSVQVPEELAHVIFRCLDKDPESRFGSAGELELSLQVCSDSTKKGPRHPRSIAILPFAHVGGDPDGDYLSDGIAESITNSLAQLSQLKVAPRGSVSRLKGLETDPQTAGRALEVRYVVTGRVRSRGDTLVVQTELTDVDQSKQLWGERYKCKIADVFAVEEDIASRVSTSLRLRLTGTDQKRLAKRFTESGEAYQLYLRGRFYWVQRTTEGMRKGAAYFQQAIAKDPAYALAFAGLADCYSVLTTYLEFPPREGWARAKAAAAAAVALDPELAEGHASWGYIHFFGDWNWEAAEAAFRRATEINPTYWMNHGWYSYVLAAWKRFEEAESEIDRATELEPLSPLVAYLSAGVATLSGHYREAEQRCLRGLRIDPDFPLLHVWLGMVYERQARYAEAVRELETGARLLGKAPLAVGSLAHAYALAGRRSDAQRILSWLLRRARGRLTDAYYIALIYTGLGEVDRAFEWLDAAAEQRGVGTLPLMIQSDPRIESLRTDPRFARILERIGLKSQQMQTISGV